MFSSPRKVRFGFTLVEVLVASAILILMLTLILNIISQASAVTRHASEKISSFQNARLAFEMINRNLSQSTLNGYWDYDDPNTPSKYLRKSELHFVVGKAGVSPFPGTAGTGEAIFFQAPLGINGNASSYGGLDGLLNACGYYVEYGTDPPPAIFQSATSPYRYRLMQVIQPTENLAVYNSTTGNSWVSTLAPNALPVADNIVYLAIWPRKPITEDALGSSLTTDFTYDSRLNATLTNQPETANQLPPLVQVTMVAIDESSAAQFCKDSNPPSQISSAMQSVSGISTQTAFDSDLAALTAKLAASRINYQVFTAVVPLRESKMQ